MQIAFWSPNHGQTGTTTAALTYASLIALRHNFKILITHSQFERSTLEQCLVKKNHLRQEELAYFNDHGLGGLRRLVKNGRLSRGMVSDYTTSLLANKNLDLLEGVYENKNYNSDEETGLLRRIFEMASEDYDMVFVDIHSGMKMELTRHLLNDSDIVVVCLNQNIQLIERFLANEEEQAILADKRIIYNFGKYDSDSKFNIKNIKRLYKLKDVMTLPYHTPYLDACNQSQSLDYLMRNLETKPKDKHHQFMKTIVAGSDQLMALTEVMEREVLKQHA